MRNPILTIAIPTYNRPEKIKRQVNSVLSQLTDDVSLVVIDNHSEKSVSELFDKETLGKFKIVRNHFNMGGDGNIAKCFDVCETEWLWTLSDDDYLSNNAVQVVLNDIRDKGDCLFINYNRKESRMVNGLKEFAHSAIDMYSYLFWISACVYNVNRLGQYMHYYYRAISTMQPGVSLIIKALADKPENKIFLSNSRIIVGGGKGIGWNRENFLYATLYIFDYLRDEASVLNHTVFKKIVSMSLMNVGLIFNNDRNFMKALKLYSIALRRRGLIKSIRYNCGDNIRFLVGICYHKVTGRKIDSGNEEDC